MLCTCCKFVFFSNAQNLLEIYSLSIRSNMNCNYDFKQVPLSAQRLYFQFLAVLVCLVLGFYFYQCDSL